MAAFFALGIVFRHAAPTPRADGVGGPLMALRGHRDANYHRASQSCLRAPYEKSTPARGLSCGELVLSGGGAGSEIPTGNLFERGGAAILAAAGWRKFSPAGVSAWLPEGLRSSRKPPLGRHKPTY